MKAVNCKSRTAFVFCEIAVEAAGSETLMASFSFDRRTCWKGQSWDSTHLWLDVSSCWPQTIKMELPWKLIVLLSLVKCVAGKRLPFSTNMYFFVLIADVAINWCPGLAHNDTVESGISWRHSPLLRQWYMEFTLHWTGFTNDKIRPGRMRLFWKLFNIWLM